MNIGFVKLLKTLRSLNKLVFVLFFIPTLLFGQIKIDKAGDDWDLKIDSAVALIKQVDSNYYNVLVEHCQHIEIWNGDEDYYFKNGKGEMKGEVVYALTDTHMYRYEQISADGKYREAWAYQLLRIAR